MHNNALQQARFLSRDTNVLKLIEFFRVFKLVTFSIQSVTNVTICGISKINQIKVHIKWKQESQLRSATDWNDSWGEIRDSINNEGRQKRYKNKKGEETGAVNAGLATGGDTDGAGDGAAEERKDSGGSE
jgi:hypothetical protein